MIKYFEIRGYDSNFDLAGSHEKPLLAIVRGTAEQAKNYAEQLPRYSCKMSESYTLKGSIEEIEVIDLTERRKKSERR